MVKFKSFEEFTDGDPVKGRLVIKPRLREIMRDKGFTQEQLAEKSGVNQATISRFDRSRMHQDWVLFALSTALGCSIEDLFRITVEG